LLVAGCAQSVVALDHTEFASIGAVQAATHQVGANTVITLDANDTITLVGVSLASMHFDVNHFELV
jgi:hypothetical protein